MFGVTVNTPVEPLAALTGVEGLMVPPTPPFATDGVMVRGPAMLNDRDTCDAALKAALPA